VFPNFPQIYEGFPNDPFPAAGAPGFFENSAKFRRYFLEQGGFSPGKLHSSRQRNSGFHAGRRNAVSAQRVAWRAAEIRHGVLRASPDIVPKSHGMTRPIWS
jgi:hypothetical protein